MRQVLLLCCLVFSGGLVGNPLGVFADDHIAKRPSIKEQAGATILMRLAFQLRRIQIECRADCSRFCNGLPDFKQVGCILKHRDEVSEQCKRVLMEEFGSEPTTEVIVYHGFPIPTGSMIYRSSRDGGIRYAIITRPTRFMGINIQPGKVDFTDGVISLSGYKEIQDVYGIQYAPPAMTLSIDGYVVFGMLAETTMFGAANYRKGFPMEFYSRRKVKSGVLAEDVMIHGRFYEANSAIFLNSDGSVSSSQKIHGDFFNQSPAEAMKKYMLQNGVLQ